MKWGHATEKNTKSISVFPPEFQLEASVWLLMEDREFPFGPEVGLPRDSVLGMLWPLLKRMYAPRSVT